MKISVFTFILICSCAPGLRGQDVKVTARLDSSKIYIGDQVYYTVTVDQPKDIHLGIPVYRDTLCKNIEILGNPVLDSSVAAGNRLRINSRYLITSFDSGFYFIPPAYAEIKDEKSVRRFYSEYSVLQVSRVKLTPPDSTDKIFDIIKPYRAPVTLGEILPWVLIALVAAACVWGIIILVRKLRRPGTVESPVVNSDPAHIIAFRELEELQAQQLWQKGEVKPYYSRLTEILRRYLENRYGVYSLEMTTSETLEELLKTGFKKDESYQGLKTILNGSDLVKFAKYKPEPSENENHYTRSWRFVESTMEKAEPDEPVAGSEEKEKRI